MSRRKVHSSWPSKVPYIHLYHGIAYLLAESLEVIQQTSAVILAALEPPTTKDQEPRLAQAS